MGLGDGGADGLLARLDDDGARRGRGDVAQDLRRRLGARVVGGDDHAAGQPGRDRAHLRPLAAVAVAAAAEHADQLAAARLRQGLQCRQRLVQRIRRVGVVHHHLRQLAAVADALHAAGHRRHGGQCARHVGQRMPLGAQRAGHAQQVGGVVVADQAGLHRDGLGALVQHEGQALAGVVQAAGGQPRVGPLDAGGPDVQPAQLGRQRVALGVVEVDHCGAQAREAEQRPLGRPVGVHGAVVVEVVLREVGEHRHPHAAAGQPALVQANAAGLDGAGLEALVAHAGEGRLQQHGVGRGQAVVVQPRRLADAQRADHAAALAQLRLGLGDPPGRRGLAVGAGDGDDVQRVGGLAEEGRGDLAGAGLQAGQRRDAGIGEAEALDIGVFHQAGGGAGGERGGDVLAAVAGITGPGDEGVTRLHLAAVGAQRAGAPFGQPAGRGLGRLQSRQHQKLSSTGTAFWLATIWLFTSRSGATPSRRSVCAVTWLNTGPATLPP